MKTTRELENAEEEVMLAMVQDINACNDPIEMFKAIERYGAFCKARTTRMEGESLVAADE